MTIEELLREIEFRASLGGVHEDCPDCKWIAGVLKERKSEAEPLTRGWVTEAALKWLAHPEASGLIGFTVKLYPTDAHTKPVAITERET